MINKFFSLFLSVLCLAAVLEPSAALAVEKGNGNYCSQEVIAEQSKELDSAAKSSLAGLYGKLSALNSAASAYIDGCKTPDKLKDEFSPIEELGGKAKLLGYGDFSKPETWKNFNYDWTKEEAPTGNNKKNCASMLKNAQSALEEAKQAEKKTSQDLYVAQNPDNICTCDENHENPSCISAASLSAEDMSRAGKCLTLNGYQQEMSTCILCPIFKTILQTIGGVASVAFKAVSAPLQKVIVAFFLALLAFEALKAVGAAAGSKISSLLKGVLLLSLKTAVALLLLSSPKYIYGYFLSPVIEGGLDMGLAMANASGFPGAHCAVINEDKVEVNSDTFSSSTYNVVMASARCFGQSAAMMPAVGRAMMCNARKAGFFGLAPDISMWISGAIVFIFGIMIWLAVTFYMIDCTVQVGMLSALVPLLIACWPFKMTEAYTFKGCKMLMNSFFSYVMIGLVMLLGTTITGFAISGDGSQINEISYAINNNDVDKLKKIYDLSAFEMIILASCCIFAMKLIGQVSALAGQFSKGSGSSIGNKMGGMAMSAATNTVKSGAKLAGKAVGAAGIAAAGATGVTAALNKHVDAVKGDWSKGWAAAGRKVGLGRFQNNQQGAGAALTGAGENGPAFDDDESDDGLSAAEEQENTNIAEDEDILNNSEDSSAAEKGESTAGGTENRENESSGAEKSHMQTDNGDRRSARAASYGRSPDERQGIDNADDRKSGGSATEHAGVNQNEQRNRAGQGADRMPLHDGTFANAGSSAESVMNGLPRNENDQSADAASGKYDEAEYQNEDSQIEKGDDAGHRMQNKNEEHGNNRNGSEEDSSLQDKNRQNEGSRSAGQNKNPQNIRQNNKQDAMYMQAGPEEHSAGSANGRGMPRNVTEKTESGRERLAEAAGQSDKPSSAAEGQKESSGTGAAVSGGDEKLSATQTETGQRQSSVAGKNGANGKV